MRQSDIDTQTLNAYLKCMKPYRKCSDYDFPGQENFLDQESYRRSAYPLSVTEDPDLQDYLSDGDTYVPVTQEVLNGKR